MRNNRLFAAALCLSLLIFSGCAGGKTNGDGSISLPEASRSPERPEASAAEPPEQSGPKNDFLIQLPAEEPVDPELEQLCRAAVNYCETATGHRPGVVRIDSIDEEGVTLQLYDDMGSHTATCAWYCIDRKTMEGSDMITGQEIAFSAYMQDEEPTQG